MLIKSCVNYYFSLSFLRKKTLKEIRKHVSSSSTIQSNNKLKFLLIWKKCRGNCQNCRGQLLRSTAIFNAIAVDWFEGNSRPGQESRFLAIEFRSRSLFNDVVRLQYMHVVPEMPLSCPCGGGGGGGLELEGVKWHLLQYWRVVLDIFSYYPNI
jgi:hypothetical protein